MNRGIKFSHKFLFLMFFLAIVATNGNALTLDYVLSGEAYVPGIYDATGEFPIVSGFMSVDTEGYWTDERPPYDGYTSGYVRFAISNLSVDIGGSNLATQGLNEISYMGTRVLSDASIVLNGDRIVNFGSIYFEWITGPTLTNNNLEFYASSFDLPNSSDFGNDSYIIWLHGELTPSPVPEPATMILLGCGLAGIVGTRFRKKK